MFDGFFEVYESRSSTEYMEGKREDQRLRRVVKV